MNYPAYLEIALEGPTEIPFLADEIFDHPQCAEWAANGFKLSYFLENSTKFSIHNSEEGLDKYNEGKSAEISLESLMNQPWSGQNEITEAELQVGFAQAMAYFGLLRDILGPLFDLDDFTTTSSPSGNRTITLWKLPGLISHCLDGLGDYDINIKTGRPPGSNHTWLALFEAAFSKARSVRFLPLGGHIEWSVAALVRTICIVVDLPTRQQRPRFDVGMPRPNPETQMRLSNKGACPYWARTYTSLYSPLLIGLLSDLNWPDAEAHEPCHQITSAMKCIGHHVDFTNYKTQHRYENCRCNDVAVDSSAVERIIEKDKIPLIKLTRTIAQNWIFTAEVVEADFNTPFTAISHVWSGGLGNPRQNSLPRCQLEYIYNSAAYCMESPFCNIISWDEDGRRNPPPWALRKYPIHEYRSCTGVAHSSYEELKREENVPICLPSPTGAQYIWMDTLCIPVYAKQSQPEDVEEKERRIRIESLKSQAIAKMAMIYSMAEYVLVLDPIIQSYKFGNDYELELAVRLCICPWMTRCWTFQEGSLAHKLYFDHSDYIFDPREYYKQITRRYLGNGIRSELIIECLTLIAQIPDISDPDGRRPTERNDRFGYSGEINHDPYDPVEDKDIEPIFFRVWNALASRVTTKKEDIHGILAATLGLSCKEILLPKSRVTSQEERMKSIFRAQDKLPLQMIFTNPANVEVCTVDSWVPLYPEGHLTAESGLMTWTSDGCGLHFCLKDLPHIDCFVFEEHLISSSLCGTHLLYIDIACENDRDMDSNTLMVVLSNEPSESSRHPKDRRFCMMLAGYNTSIYHEAVLFEIVEQNNMDMVITHVSHAHWVADMSKITKTERTTTTHVYRGHLAPKNLNFVLNCGELWRKPKYRRPAAVDLEADLSNPIFAVVMIVWGIESLCAIIDPSRSQLGVVVEKIWFEPNYSLGRIPLVGPLARYFLKWVVRYPGITHFYSIMILRGITFELFENARLRRLCRKIQHERLASSFDYSDNPTEKKTIDRSDSQLSYQYDPAWTVTIPFMLVSMTLAFTRYTLRGNVMKRLSNLEAATYRRAMGRMAVAVIAETTIRIVGEAAWRYLGLGTPVGREKWRQSNVGKAFQFWLDKV